jgi:hypothetical protein
MTFSVGRRLSDDEKAKVLDIVKEVHGKTIANPNFAVSTPPTTDAPVDHPTEDINPDDVPL